MIPSSHRPTSATIDLSAIRKNIEKVRAHIPKQAEIWAVVKANAYGHGAVKVSQAISNLSDAFCVSNLDEAIELRQAGIKNPILILSIIKPSDAHLAMSYNIRVTAASLEWLKLVLAVSSDLSGLKMQIKVDSGMGRIGIKEVAEANAMIEMMDRRGVLFDGIFTHFATADEEKTEKFQSQGRKFEEILAGLKRKPIYIHSTNSAAAIWHPTQVLDIERLGLGLYGLDPSNGSLPLPFELEPALSLESELLHVKEIQAGETVGYGATYEAETPTYIGTVPIGYADGWTRDMQGFSVLVDGKFCEIVGRVSMDQITIKLDRPYSIGEKVTLIGKDGKNEITVDDVARWRRTINYEVLTLLSDRIDRKYID